MGPGAATLVRENLRLKAEVQRLTEQVRRVRDLAEEAAATGPMRSVTLEARADLGHAVLAVLDGAPSGRYRPQGDDDK
jgi:hypothetical protein